MAARFVRSLGGPASSTEAEAKRAATWLAVGLLTLAAACGGGDDRGGTRSTKGSSGASSGSTGAAEPTSGRPSGDRSGGSGTPARSGSVASSGASPSEGGDAAAPATSSSTFVPAPPERSCESEKCTADETCKEGPFGTYCLHPCKGQPCPQGTEPYCSRAGGLVCVATP